MGRRGLVVGELLARLAVLAVLASTVSLAFGQPTPGDPSDAVGVVGTELLHEVTADIKVTTSTSTTVTTATSSTSTSTTTLQPEVSVTPLQRSELARVLAEKELTACRAARTLAEQDALLRVMARQAAADAGVDLETVDYDAARGVFRPRGAFGE